jgi:hypothetical protein
LYTQYPNYTVAAFAALSGYTLDTENSLTVSDTFTGNLPVYRLTGMELSVNVDFSNFRAINEYDPFNFDDHATMTVRLINGGDFVSPEYKNVDFNAVTLEAATAGATYEFRGVYLDFQSSGLMGVFDWYTMIVAIIACFVLIGIATSVMDVLGAFVYDSFKNDKYEDDGERQHIEHMILNMETNGVPFRHDDFQVMPNVSIRDFLKVLQRDIVKLSTLAHHMSRDLSAAGLNRHTMEIAQIDASAVKAARFVCVLIGPERAVPHRRPADVRARARRDALEEDLAQAAERHREHAHGRGARPGAPDEELQRRRARRRAVADVDGERRSGDHERGHDRARVGGGCGRG